MCTDMWSELSIEREVRYTGNVRFFVTAMSETSGEAEWLYRLVVGFSVPKIIQEFFRRVPSGVSPVS